MTKIEKELPLHLGSSEVLVEKYKFDFTKPFERVMVFIDGAYLRERCKKYWGRYDIHWGKLSASLLRMFNTYGTNPFNINLIRIYYYDAIAPEGNTRRRSQLEYFSELDKGYASTIRLRTLVESSKGLKQKGVDVLMAIDALSKAYQNHYETGMFLVADADFIPLIETVKDSGKKTIGIFERKTCSKELEKRFDMRIWLDKNGFKGFLK